MNKEFCEKVIALARDASGITAYQWAQTEKAPKVPAILRKPFGVVCAFKEFSAPAFSRIDREIPQTEDLSFRLTRLSGFLRDSLTFLLPAGLFVTVASITDIQGVSSIALLLSKFVLNGVVHREFSKHKIVNTN